MEEKLKIIHEPCKLMEKILFEYIDMLKERIQTQEKIIHNLEEIIKIKEITDERIKI